MYGSLTRARRDLPMKENKLFRANKKIVSAKVDFPAKRMAKTKRNGKYESIKGVKFGKRG